MADSASAPTLDDVNAAIAARQAGGPTLDDVNAAIAARQATQAAPSSNKFQQFMNSPWSPVPTLLKALPTAGMIAGGIGGGALGGLAGTAVEPVGGTIAGGAAGGVAGAAFGNAEGTLAQNLGEKYLLGKDNPLSYSDLGEAAKQGAYGQMLGEGIGTVGKAAIETPPGQYILKKAGSLASTVGSAFSGIPKQEIETYAKNAQEINQLAKSGNYSNQEMADNLRSNINSDIQQTKQQLYGQMSQSFNARAGQTVEAQPILDKLNSAKSQINATLRPEEIKQVDDIISQVNSVSKKGQISLQDAHDLKEILQEQAGPSYSKNGQIFQNGVKAQQAAKGAGAVTRQLVNTAAPEVASANSTLAQLHDIEDTMNGNLLAEGKTSASIYGAGSGSNEANAKTLKDLGQITGQDYLGQAQKISAARTFGKAALLPVDTNGKTVARLGVAGGAGYLMGGLPGALIAEGVASPLGMKGIINAGVGAGNISQLIAQKAPSVIGQGAMSMLPNSPMPAPQVAPQPSSPAPNQQLSPPHPGFVPPQPQATPPQNAQDAKLGPDKWASDGFHNLKGHVNDADRSMLEKNQDAMMVDKNAKELLITASHYEPGSKPLDDVMKHLRKQFGDK